MKSDWLKMKVKEAQWKPHQYKKKETTVQTELQTSWIGDEDLSILSIQFDETLARWWAALNDYEWPEELPRPEPAHFIHGGRRSRIMGWIEAKIGLRKCLREWNREKMTEEEFDHYWYAINGMEMKED